MSWQAPGNAVLLIASFAIGQGSIFLAQTWLVGRGDLELLARFGACFSFAILALLVVDGGAVASVARRVALADCDGDTAEIRRCFWSASIVRLCVAGVIASLASLYAAWTQDEFGRAYARAAIPALALWAFNAGGVLDGLKLSGMTGLTGVASYLCSAAILLPASTLAPDKAGLLLGSALSAGCGLTVILQLLVLRHVGHLPGAIWTTRRHCVALAREGASALLAVLPGQLSFRFQIVVCSMFLGPEATAIFLYGRLVAAAGSQVLEFVRRAHFPLLVRNLATGTAPAWTAFRVQRLASWLSVFISAGLLAGGLLISEVTRGATAAAALVVCLFSLGVLSGALSSTLSQAAQALGCYRAVAVSANGAMLVCLAASAALSAWLGLAGLAIAEVMSHVVMALCLWPVLSLRRASLRVPRGLQ
ncbi:hypothetical protein JNB88_29420 [Rhizobium cauense]|uniref:lipopolysaccharide biosynthesis protein n=1 Tax=Rhizobium cauense TaxID=1166683 RepID=UPI001C6E3C1E|nr:hypothetical protein [Rhizobium cauense]MBW9117740.1 hypothetical protein [Rhizobium cauense]